MKLRQYRLSIDKTQAECAEQLAITKEYFSELETGKKQPSRLLTEKIIRWSGYQITIADLWNFDNNE